MYMCIYICVYIYIYKHITFREKMAHHIQRYNGLGWLCLLGAKKVTTRVKQYPSEQGNTLCQQGLQLCTLCLAQLII